jgi:peptidoglycan/xylan/chitin deacetylase (PgdA/CDA1 family)
MPISPGLIFSSFEHQETRLYASIDRLLDICDRYSIRATWFVLGTVAERKPAILRKIHAAGHEIASHGYGHRLVSSMSSDEFREDLRLSCMILENITGEKVLGFRAPSWSVNKAFLSEYYDILAVRVLNIHPRSILEKPFSMVLMDSLRIFIFPS